MRFFAIGQQAEGFIAIGQEATGVIAIGQLATGVIAIGQVARGVIAVGMASFGLFSLGMLSVGLVYAVGMLGAGGRAGPGAILPLVPVPRPRATPRGAVPARGAARPIVAVIQLAILCGVAYAYWALVLVEVGDLTLGIARELARGIVS